MISDSDIPQIKSFVKNSIGKINQFEVEYFDIVDDTELIPVNKRSEMVIGKRYFGCIAVRAGKIRLIDNIEIGLV
jgi:pantoate--beta-alanine ligase